MKKKIFVLMVFLLFCQFIFADKMDLSVGGGLTGYLIPSVNYSKIDTVIKNPAPIDDIKINAESVNLLFGFAVSVPLVFTYYFSNDWGVGVNVELGYSFQGGPHVYYKDPPHGYVPTEYTYIYNSFLGIVNVIGKSPKLGYDIRVLIETGVIVRPGVLIGFHNSERLDFPLGSGENNYRVLCYVGPNLFLGFQKDLSPSLVMMPGLRASAEFAYFETSAKDFSQKEFYVQANFGLEFRILWNYTINK